MRKIKYKAVSPEMERMAAPNFSEEGRSSLGMEQFVNEYFFVDVTKLIPYRHQARKFFDEEEIKKLSETIQEHGIRQPLTILRSTEKTGFFEVISGERRLRASKLIGLKKVPCIIMEDDERAAEVALIENIQRENLHPIELGDALSSLLEKSRWGDITKLADRLGKNQSTISNYLAYSKIPEVIKKYLLEKNITSRPVLRKILKCQNVEEMEKVLGIMSPDKLRIQKSILRVNMESGKIIIQDSQIYKLSFVHREELKNKLKNIVSKIEELDQKE